MILGTFAGGQPPRTNYNQTDPSKADYLLGRENIADHLESKNNPHGVTAEQAGARPDTWLPTIAEIGAAPAGHTDVKCAVSSYAEFITRIQNTFASIPDNSEYRLFVNFSVSEGVIPAGSWFITVKREWENYGVVELINDYYHMFIRKYATWQEPEFDNPPMALGVEYRTTERWNGKAVYTKLINCGLLPAVGTTSSTGIHASREITQAIRAEGQFIFKTDVGGGDAIPYFAMDVGEICITATRYTAKITTVSWNGTVPGVEAYARVWYVLD